MDFDFGSKLDGSSESVAWVVTLRVPLLHRRIGTVDTENMIDADLILALENPRWVLVLRAYQQALETLAEPQSAGAPEASEDETASDEPQSEADVEGSPKHRRAARWMSRIAVIEGVAKDELSKIHGRLIAYGFLKCDLAERTAEVVYQLTLAGKQVLNHAAACSDDGSECEAA